MSGRSIREEAAILLDKVIRQGAFSSLVLHASLSKNAFSDRDRALLTEIVYGALLYRIPIEKAIQENLRMPFSKVDPFVQGVLRCGAYELMFLRGSKSYASVHEAVETVKRSRFHPAAPLVNAVLRRVSERAERPFASEEVFPEWLVRKLTEDYGEARAEAIMSAIRKEKALCLRADPRFGTREELLEELKDVDPRAGELCPDSIYVRKKIPAKELPCVREGRAFVQDEGSALAAYLCGVRERDRVLDMCAAPGSKSFYLAALMHDHGTVESRDISEKRAGLIEKGAKRYGLSSIRVRVRDGREALQEDRASYRAVLLDAPCSGLGVIRSKPEILFRQNRESMKELSSLQRELLETAAEAVAPGGRLVYSTCTLNRGENEDQVRDFLGRHPEFEAEDLSRRFPKEGVSWEAGPFLTLFPEENGHDGFFVSVLNKK